MLIPTVVDQIRDLARAGRGIKAIAHELGIARNTVRRYLAGAVPGHQQRPTARALGHEDCARAAELFVGAADGNVAVVQAELAASGRPANLRTLQRALAPLRRERAARAVATVRFETAPGEQMQIDFGQKTILIAGVPTVVYLMACVLGYSRRIHCRPYLAQRQDDWLEGIHEAFIAFGGMPRHLLCDNASPLVRRHDHATRDVTWARGFAAFCDDRGIARHACFPGRARTKGKVENGVKYVKRNALAARQFPSFAYLRDHLLAWCVGVADVRWHGTTGERPTDRFEAQERQALLPLPARPLPVRTRRLWRKVGADCLVDIDSVRYSVPHRLARQAVEVVVSLVEVEVWCRGECVARHRRSDEPRAIVRDPRHFDGLYRRITEATATATATATASGAGVLGPYAAIVEGGRA